MIRTTRPTARMRKHFGDKLDLGGVEASARIAQALFRRATSDGPNSVVAAIFWLKARADSRGRPEPEPPALPVPGPRLAPVTEDADAGTPWEAGDG